MTPACALMQSQLIGFHFGVVAGEERAALEAHLGSCPACLAAFLAVKRDVETAEAAPAPAPEVGARIRAAVARELRGGEPTPARWTWWERPLAFACAGLTVFLAVLAVQAVATGDGRPPHGLAGSPPAVEAAP